MLTLELGTSPRHVKHYLCANIFDTPAELTAWHGRVDYILANPPFSLRIDNEQFDSRLFREGYRSSDALFIDTALNLLRPGGRLICLLPHSIIANSEFAMLRSTVEELWNVLAIICLPEGVFQLNAGTTTRADIVVLEKRLASRDRANTRIVLASVPSVGIRLNNLAKDTRENELETLLISDEVRKALGI